MDTRTSTSNLPAFGSEAEDGVAETMVGAALVCEGLEEIPGGKPKAMAR